jgi:hypothetical protein
LNLAARSTFASVLALALLGACARKDAEPAPGAASSAAPATSVPAPPSASDCDAAKRALAAFIASLPAGCDKDEDCGGYYLQDDLCAGSVMLHVPGCPPPLKPRLFQLQSNERGVCPRPPPCDVVPYRAVCRAGRCVDALKK